MEEKEKFDAVERLGLAYCRLNCREWDTLFGEKPEGFDDFPEGYKHRIVMRKIALIETLIGEMNTSRCWWKFRLHRTEEAWKAWYFSDPYRLRDILPDKEEALKEMLAREEAYDSREMLCEKGQRDGKKNQKYLELAVFSLFSFCLGLALPHLLKF